MGGVGIYALKVMPMPWHGLWKFGTYFDILSPNLKSDLLEKLTLASYQISGL
jgi:hypothetical protein